MYGCCTNVNIDVFKCRSKFVIHVRDFICSPQFMNLYFVCLFLFFVFYLQAEWANIMMLRIYRSCFQCRMCRKTINRRCCCHLCPLERARVRRLRPLLCCDWVAQVSRAYRPHVRQAFLVKWHPPPPPHAPRPHPMRYTFDVLFIVFNELCKRKTQRQEAAACFSCVDKVLSGLCLYMIFLNNRVA